MPRVRYGADWIEYTQEEKQGLKSHYISVDKEFGVRLKGTKLPAEKANALILKKAHWITAKIKVVKTDDPGEIVTGSRLPYLGKSYYVQVKIDQGVDKVNITFNHSCFRITINNSSVRENEIKTSLKQFYKKKAEEKILPKIQKLSTITGLRPLASSIRVMAKRWGSCTQDNKIIINVDVIKLPYSLIEYIIIHELCHTKYKDHSKKFWMELSKHVSNWKLLDHKIQMIKI